MDVLILEINNIIQLNIPTRPYSLTNLFLLQALEILYYLRSEYLFHPSLNPWRSLKSDGSHRWDLFT